MSDNGRSAGCDGTKYGQTDNVTGYFESSADLKALESICYLRLSPADPALSAAGTTMA